jgi:predicted NAD/FAD-dependent oxidoreductase
MSEKVLIIGAGISGLMAANILKQAGHSVTILEKSRGVGGRMATRRFKDGRFDHGAQYFTVRHPQFKPWVDHWKSEGVVREWTRNIPIEGKSAGNDGHPRYIGTNGMTAIAKHLSKDLDVKLNTRIETIYSNGDFWLAKSVDGKEFSTKYLTLTAPVPQSLSLLEAGKIPFPESEISRLKNIQYRSCIAVLVLLEGSSNIPSPGGIKIKSGPIQWLADNTQKGISPHATAITIHASAEFSKENYDLDEKQLLEILLKASKPWLQNNVVEWQVHKWRFSQPKHAAKSWFIKIGQLPSIYIAGDAFGGARVEGAALSGIKAGLDLLNHLTHR